MSDEETAPLRDSPAHDARSIFQTSIYHCHTDYDNDLELATKALTTDNIQARGKHICDVLLVAVSIKPASSTRRKPWTNQSTDILHAHRPLNLSPPPTTSQQLVAHAAGRPALHSFAHRFIFLILFVFTAQQDEVKTMYCASVPRRRNVRHSRTAGDCTRRAQARYIGAKAWR